LLVVDDQPGVRRLVRWMMTGRGWRVITAPGVAMALVVARNVPVDVALCDIVMPGSGGVEFLQRMRAAAPATRVLLMSGYDPAATLRGRALPGANAPVAVLEKPFSRETLEDALAHVMGRDG
jgi:DNA-binding NtrC family response regulator